MKNVYVGGYGAGNLGDDLILSSILSKDSSAVIVAYGMPMIDKTIHYISFNEFIHNVHKIILCDDTLIFGGGGLFWSHDHIYEMLILALVAKSIGAQVELRRVGLHGFQMNTAASKHLLRIADVVSLREHDSLDLARRILECNHAILEPDYVETIKMPDRHLSNSKLNVGINVATTKFTHEPDFANHVCMIYAEISSIYRDILNFYYIPFCIHMSEENQNDLSRADALFFSSEGRIKYRSDVISTSTLMAACAQTDIFLGERFHMHVIARQLGCPMVPLIHNQQTKYRAISQEYKESSIFYETSQAMIIDQISSTLGKILEKHLNNETV